jgi:hypothetical protein
MRKAREAVARSRASWTVLPDGDIRSGKESFQNERKQVLTKMLEQLDPNGVFMKK